MHEGLDPAPAMAPARKRRFPGPLMILAMLAAGSAGSLTAVAALSKDTVEIAPFLVEVQVLPAASGTTRLGVDPAASNLNPYTTEANTHAGPLEFVAKVVGVTGEGISLDQARTIATAQNPRELSGYLREHGRPALRAYGLKLAAFAGLGGLVGGLVVAFGQWKRTLFTMVAGLAVVAGLGVVAGTTYDVNAFRGSSVSGGP